MHSCMGRGVRRGNCIRLLDGLNGHCIREWGVRRGNCIRVLWGELALAIMNVTNTAGFAFAYWGRIGNYIREWLRRYTCAGASPGAPCALLLDVCSYATEANPCGDASVGFRAAGDGSGGVELFGSVLNDSGFSGGLQVRPRRPAELGACPPPPTHTHTHAHTHTHTNAFAGVLRGPRDLLRRRAGRTRKPHGHGPVGERHAAVAWRGGREQHEPVAGRVRRARVVPVPLYFCVSECPPTPHPHPHRAGIRTAARARVRRRARWL